MRFSSFFLSMFLLAGCATEAADASSTDQAIASATAAGVDVKASWQPVVTGTPTYGSDATTPFAKIEVTVEDAALRAAHPGFDGEERPFALVPRKNHGTVTWERVTLGFTGTRLEGYIALHSFDVYDSDGIRLSEDDLAAGESLGISVGLDTNVGTIWAQTGGRNFPLLRAE